MSDQAIEHRRFSRALHKSNHQAPAGAQGSDRVACDWDGGPEGVRTTLPMATTVRKDDPRRLGRSSAEGSSSASSAVPCRVVSASSASSSIASIGPGIQADRRSRVAPPREAGGFTFKWCEGMRWIGFFVRSRSGFSSGLWRRGSRTRDW